MLIDRSPREDIVARVPQMAARIDPILRQLDHLLDDDALDQAARADVCRRRPRTARLGRPSTPGESLLRMLLLKHLQQWSFQETEDQVDQNLILRWFCRLSWQETPDDTTRIRWAQTLQPETLHRLVARTAELARQAKVTQGRKLRLDGTCVQTDIHHPTDSGLLVDSVRRLSRLVKRAKDVLVTKVARRCASGAVHACRPPGARPRPCIGRGTRKGEDKDAEQKKRYQTLIETTEQMVHQATQVVQVLSQATGALAQRLVRQAQDVLPLVERVIHQTRQRVFLGQKVSSDEKVLSLREPHTKTVPRHTGGQLVEFGRQVTLDEVDGGIVTRDEILAHPTEHGQAVPAVEHHQALFDHPPGLVAGDRGVHATDTEARLRRMGVTHVAIPASGRISEARRAEEHTRAFRGYRFRAGTRGRIASLRRDDGWRTCRDHGLDGMERWLGLGLMESLLNRIAQTRG